MSSAVDLKTKEEKDAELDRRIEALRKKNEALVKRYQEIEEDKKKAEQEGIAVTTPRKPRPHEPDTDRRKTEKENFTVTVDLSKPAGEKRVVNDWKPGPPRGPRISDESDGQKGQNDSHSPPRRTGSGRLGRGGQRGGGRGGGGGGGGGRPERREGEVRTPRSGEPVEAAEQRRRGGRRGRGGGGEGGGGGGATPGGIDRKSKEWEEKRRQNIEKMNEEMERIAEYERGQRVDGDKPIRNFLDDPRRSGPAPDIDRKEGSRRHVRNWGGLDFDNVKTGAELEKEWTSRRPGPKGSMDMTMSMTGRERAEYLRWKKEREQIDEERLARHRNATGQWRREWDAQKTESMFKEDTNVATEGITSEPGSGRDDSKRPPKAPTFGDFLSQGRTPGGRGDRSRGKGRGQKPSYSMHDNRWEGDKEEDKEKEKEDKPKREEKTKPTKKEEKPKPPTTKQVQVSNEDGEEDEEEWEDATSDEDEEIESDSEHGSEKKDTVKEKTTESKDPCPASSPSRSGPSSSASPKEQRTPRPKVYIPPPSTESTESGKPLSPFSPLDGHRPVTDWGEEMEMVSPRSSMGGESPLKPSSAESSPPQKKNQEEEQKEEEQQVEAEEEDGETKSQTSVPEETTEPKLEAVTATEVSSPSEKVEPEREPLPPDTVAVTSTDAAPSDISVQAAPEISDAPVSENQETPAPPSKINEPETASSPAVQETEQDAPPASHQVGGEDDETVPAETDADPTAAAESSD